MLGEGAPGFGCELKGFPKSINAHYIGPLRSMWESKKTFISWSGAGFLVHYSSKALLRAQTSDRKGRFAIYLKPIAMPLLLSYDIWHSGTRKNPLSH